jgi:hypothetical protein
MPAISRRGSSSSCSQTRVATPSISGEGMCRLGVGSVGSGASDL